jgi:hypothetical protein
MSPLPAASSSAAPYSATPSYDVRYSYAGYPPEPNTNFSYTGQSWFGPLPPLRPIAPPEVAGREWDFIPGYNITTKPRAWEPVDFDTLRDLAESYDPLHLVIERRKDQMCRLPWQIRLKHEGKGNRPKFHELNPSDQDRINEIVEFFKRPDGEHSFRTWFRAVLDDLFVIDAPTLFCDRNRGGKLINLSYIDGGTIKRIIDDWGRTPRPIRWIGQPFVWNGVTITEENYLFYQFKLIDGLMYPPAYQQVLKGLPAVDYTTWDLIYRPYNLRPGRVYGYSPVEQVLMTVSIALRRQWFQLEYYREGNMPEALIGLPESWTPDQIQRFQDYWDNLHSGNLGQRRHAKFIAASSHSAYWPFKEPPLKNEFDEWLARVICLAFSYPPNALVSLSNRSIADQHQKQAEEEGLGPVKDWSSELFTDIIEREFGQSDIEHAYIEEDEIDQEKQGKILTGYTGGGILTINQARNRLGEEPDPNPAANQLMIKTATGLVPIESNTIEGRKAIEAAFPPPEPEVGGDLEGEKSEASSAGGGGKEKTPPPQKIAKAARDPWPEKRLKALIECCEPIIAKIKINRDYQVPLLAGADKKLRQTKIVYVDYDLPETLKAGDKEFSPDETLPWHECPEWVLMELGSFDVDGMWSDMTLDYDDAHAVALQVEEWFVTTRLGLDWKAYDKAFTPWIKTIENEKLKRGGVPPDLYRGPYDSPDEKKYLDELLAAEDGKKKKKAKKAVAADRVYLRPGDRTVYEVEEALA